MNLVWDVLVALVLVVGITSLALVLFLGMFSIAVRMGLGKPTDDKDDR